MKPFAVQVLGFFAAVAVVSGAADPIKEYLSSFSPLGGDNRVYSDDRLLRLDLDLNNDGQKEVMLSMARDRDGKQGNVWTAYIKDQNDYHAVGGLTFDPTRFYVGNIDEIHRYGLVTFGPSGGGEGVVRAYLFDGSRIREVQVAAVSRDQQTRELTGLAVRNKYLREKATSGDEITTVIDATALSQKYGVKVEATTYRQAIEQLLVVQSNSVPQAATPRSLSRTSPPASPSYSVASDSPAAASAPLDSAAGVKRSKPIWPWLAGIFAAALFGFLVWKARA